MLPSTAIRAASVLALSALLVACAEQGGPTENDFRAPTPQFNAMELLITILGGSGSQTTTGANPPSFSLSTVPTQATAGIGWSRTIAIDPHGPFGPDMAVDYGDGSGPRDLNVSRSGGVWSFTLSRTYAAAGTYTVKVVATTNADGVSSRYATATISVAPDLRVFIDDFQIDSTVIQGVAAPFSFYARGPAGPNYAVTMTYGTNLTQSAFVPANSTYASSFIWSEPGTYEIRATISNGDQSATQARTVIVEPQPIVIGSYVAPDSINFGEEASFSFRASGPVGSPYTVTIDHGDGSEPVSFPMTPGAVVARTHTWAASGLYELSIVVSNGHVSTTHIDTVAVYRPRPTVDNVSIPDTLRFNEASAIYFVPNDASPVEAMVYQIVVSLGPDQSNDVQELVTPGEPVEIPIQAPDQEEDYEIRIFVGTVLNRLVLYSDTVVHTLRIRDLVCTSGTYSDGSACVDAPAGSYVPDDGASAPIPCAVGTYQDLAGQTSCIEAQPGYYVSQTGATQAVACPLGTFQPASGQTGCIEAPVGSYVDVTGAVTAVPCPAAATTMAVGSTSSAECIPLGQAAMLEIGQAVNDGTLVPASPGNGGQKQLENWVASLNRAAAFLEGPQREAGCAAVRNALARADGLRSPPDVVSGPARPAAEAALRRILAHYGCSAR